jgi:hypothetical protein
MTLIQWVNLDSDDFDAYSKVDPEITSKDRCGKISIKTAFEKDKVPLDYKVKVTPSGGTADAKYTPAELGPGRNPNFKMTKGLADLGNETEVLMTEEIKLPAAGGNKYKLTAKDANDKEVESAEIETKRKMYYQFIYMDDASGKVTPYSLQPLEEHCKKHHIVLTKVGPDKKIPFHKTIDMASSNAFDADAAQAYDLSEPLKKIGCATVLSNYIASNAEFELAAIYNIGGPSNLFCVVSATKITINGDISGWDYLWHGLDDADDAAKRWFVAGEAEYTDAKGVVSETVTIDRNHVEPGSVIDFSYGGTKDVVIDKTPELQALLAKPDGNVKFTLTLIKADGFYNGFSSGGGITTSATKVQWEDRDVPGALNTWKHEFGHRIGMVSYGDKRNSVHGSFHSNPSGILPDAPPTLYGERYKENDKSHQGPHCEKGVTYNAASKIWSGTPQCIMFGSSGSSTAQRLPDYCSECAIIVRKLDLSANALKG